MPRQKSRYETRRFDGKVFVLSGAFATKKEAQGIAKENRADGWNTRIIQDPGYQIWLLYSNKRKRR